MAFDPTIPNPAYAEYAPSWQLMRDTFAGEDDVKKAGEKYLPMKSGIAAIQSQQVKQAAYNMYRTRAEVPELVAPTVRGAVGVMLGEPAEIELPAQMEHLRERATLDGLGLEALHRRMAIEVMTTGRYGLLAGIADGVPHLSGYVAESIVSWDGDDYISLNETGLVRNRDTGDWDEVEKYRVLTLEDGRFVARVWVKGTSGWTVDDEAEAADPRGRALDFIPFVFVGTNDLTPAPDDVPLYGLGKLVIRVYRLDADYVWGLHMTSEPTPWVNGFSDPENQTVPTTIGSAKLWVLPEGAEAGYLEFSGPGLSAQKSAIDDSMDRAAQFGAQVIQMGASAESGEALKLRAASQTATLTTIAQTTASGLEQALRNIAVWIGANPDDVTVTPNLEFFDRTLTPDEARAIWEGWLAGVYDWRVALDRLKRGNWVDEDADPDEIEARLKLEGTLGDDLIA